MKFTKKFGLAMIAICLVLSLASCQDDGVELTEEQFIQACKDGDAELVKKALKKNKKLVNAKNNDGWTALMLASINGHKEVVEILLAKGADVNAKDNSGATALMSASMYGKKDIVELLIVKGADVNAKVDSEETALMKALFGRKDEIAKLLIAKGADVNAQAHDGRSALLHAAENGELEIVKTLVENGAAITIKTENGENAAIELTQDQGHTEVVQYLKQQLAKLPLSERGEYIKVNGWEELKLKKKEFLGKKVSMYINYQGLSLDGDELDLVGVHCPFDRKLVDKIVRLEIFENYTFYGTVKEGDWLNPVVLYVEEIE